MFLYFIHLCCNNRKVYILICAYEHMGVREMRWIVGGERIDVKGENVKLRQVKVYYKRNKDKLLECIIIRNPEDAWIKIVEYAKMLRERYNKTIELKIVSFNGKKYLKFHRVGEGIPIYIDRAGNFYVAEKYRNQMAKINVAIRYLAETCGYRIKIKTAVKHWIR